MATFTASLSSSYPGRASLSGSFTGGDASYSRYRIIQLHVDGTLIGNYNSTTAGGASSSFSANITNAIFISGSHSWTATLGYYDESSPVWTEYSISGTISVPYVSTITPIAGIGVAQTSPSSETTIVTASTFRCSMESGYSFTKWSIFNRSDNTTTVNRNAVITLYPDGDSYYAIANPFYLTTSGNTITVSVKHIPGYGYYRIFIKKGSETATEVGRTSDVDFAYTFENLDYSTTYTINVYAAVSYQYRTTQIQFGAETITTGAEPVPDEVEVYYNNGTEWVKTEVYYNNGTTWVQATPKYNNGSEWQ